MEPGSSTGFAGFRPSAVVTNLLDPKLVSREDWMRMATVDEAAEEHGVDALRISFTQAWHELLDMRQTLLTATPQRVARVLLPRLKQRIAQHLVPPRPGRYYPRPGDKYKKGRCRQAAKLVTEKA